MLFIGPGACSVSGRDIGGRNSQLDLASETRDGDRGDDSGRAAVSRDALGSPPRPALSGDGALRAVGNSDPPTVGSPVRREIETREGSERELW